jgi:hypothetical protein
MYVSFVFLRETSDRWAEGASRNAGLCFQLKLEFHLFCRIDGRSDHDVLAQYALEDIFH